jgi:hypothetical protein
MRTLFERSLLAGTGLLIMSASPTCGMSTMGSVGCFINFYANAKDYFSAAQ